MYLIRFGMRWRTHIFRTNIKPTIILPTGAATAQCGEEREVQAQLGQRLIRYAERLPELASVLDKLIRHYYGCAVRRRGVSPYYVDWLAK